MHRLILEEIFILFLVIPYLTLSLLLSLIPKGTITRYARYMLVRKLFLCLFNICLYCIDRLSFLNFQEIQAHCVTYYFHFMNFQLINLHANELGNLINEELSFSTCDFVQ